MPPFLFQMSPGLALSDMAEQLSDQPWRAELACAADMHAWVSQSLSSDSPSPGLLGVLQIPLHLCSQETSTKTVVTGQNGVNDDMNKAHCPEQSHLPQHSCSEMVQPHIRSSTMVTLHLSCPEVDIGRAAGFRPVRLSGFMSLPLPHWNIPLCRVREVPQTAPACFLYWAL